MVNDTLLKLRTLGAVGLLTLAYPTVLLLALWTKVYQSIFGRAKVKSIAGEIAVITGGAHGLGKELAEQLATHGCHVAIVDINQTEAEKTAQSIQAKYKVKAKAYKVDVSNFEAVQELNAQVTQDLGATTILVNNAGVLLCSSIFDPDWRDIQRMINVNLTAHFWTNKVFLPKMKELRRGHIVAISSASSLFPLMHHGPYTSTKFAVRGLMRSLRQELKAEVLPAVRATTVFPSFLQTNADVVKLVKRMGFNDFYPLISGVEAAERIVLGMLRNEEEIVLPGFMAFLYRLLEVLPSSWQDWFLLAPLLISADRYKKFKTL